MAKKKKKEILVARKEKGDIVRLPSDELPDYDIIAEYIENNYPLEKQLSEVESAVTQLWAMDAEIRPPSRRPGAANKFRTT